MAKLIIEIELPDSAMINDTRLQLEALSAQLQTVLTAPGAPGEPTPIERFMSIITQAGELTARRTMNTATSELVETWARHIVLREWYGYQAQQLNEEAKRATKLANAISNRAYEVKNRSTDGAKADHARRELFKLIGNEASDIETGVLYAIRAEIEKDKAGVHHAVV